MAEPQINRNSVEARHCLRCGQDRPVSTWLRYEKNDRLTTHCVTCNAENESNRRLTAEAKTRGYKARGNTPEYKRMQREREYVVVGKVIRPYVTTVERQRIAALKRAEGQADQLRSCFARDWLKPFRKQLDADYYKVDALYQEQEKARAREYYHRKIERSRQKVATYKATHSTRVDTWHATRAERIALQGDGSVTEQGLKRLRESATSCAYCGGLLCDRRQTDHILALCHGGEHTYRNIAVACSACNASKARLLPMEWLCRVPESMRLRVIRLYAERGIVAIPQNSKVLPRDSPNQG